MSEGPGTATQPASSVSRVGPIRHLIEPLVLTISFLTILPVRTRWSLAPQSFPRAVALFPAVGLLIGGVVAAVDLAGQHVLPISTTSALDLLLLAIVSGGLHLDGLMDSCDGLFLSGGAERRLSVMKDSRVGSFGVLGLAFALLVQYSALTSLSGPARAALLVVVPCISRWSMVLALWAFPYARASGLGSPFKDGLGVRHVLVATLLCVAVPALIRPSDLLLVPLAALVTFAAGSWMVSRLGGLTGDSYGAVSEVVTSVLFIALAGRWV